MHIATHNFLSYVAAPGVLYELYDSAVATVPHNSRRSRSREMLIAHHAWSELAEMGVVFDVVIASCHPHILVRLIW